MSLLVVVLLKTVFVLVLVVGVFAPLMAWTERKASAVLQKRFGPERAEARGVAFLRRLQPLSVVIRSASGGDFERAGANRVLHALVPMLAAVPAIAAFAVIPYGASYAFGDTRVSFVVADIDWGLLYVFAVGSIATYATLLAGGAVAEDAATPGAVRAAAQMVSYEVVLGFSAVGVFLVFSSLRLTDIALAQDQLLWSLWGPIGLPNWGIFLQPLGFVLFLTCIIARQQRPPFDDPEAGNAGTHFGLFHLAEFIEVVVIAGLLTSLFFGGWTIPMLSTGTIIGGLGSLFGNGAATILCALLHVASFVAKMVAMIGLQVLVRGSMRRFGYDQRMDLCWRVLLPLSLLNIFVTAGALVVFGRVG